MTNLQAELNQLEQKCLKRSLRVVTEASSARLTIDGKPLVNFSSNNYLGLARDPRVIEAVRQVLDHWGVGATSSRLISGSSIIHQDLEDALAAFLGRKAALLFPTGYMANLGLVTSLVGQGDAVILDRLCHASLIDAARLSGARLFVYRHGDAEDAEKVLKRTADYRRRLLITESLFSMNGDFAPLGALVDLARRYEAISMVDEAHAMGVWGEAGRGLSAPSPLMGEGWDGGVRPSTPHPSPPPQGGRGDWDVVVGTLSKALGSQGGFVAGSRELIDTLVNRARSFIYTTGLSPACVAAAQAALSIVQEDAAPRRHLQKLSDRLREELCMQGWDILHSESQIIPILLGDAKAALACAERLQQAGFFAPAIRPPTVHAGECRIRFSVTAEHTEKDIDDLLRVMSSRVLSKS